MASLICNTMKRKATRRPMQIANVWLSSGCERAYPVGGFDVWSPIWPHANAQNTAPPRGDRARQDRAGPRTLGLRGPIAITGAWRKWFPRWGNPKKLMVGFVHGTARRLASCRQYRHVLRRLSPSQQGWNVMPTARNARSVDLLAYDVGAHIYNGIQVKALSRRVPVPLGNTVDKFMGEWWIITGTPIASANRLHSCRSSAVQPSGSCEHSDYERADRC